MTGAHSRGRWGCPYINCGVMPLVNGDGSLRKHPYEGFPVCPGSGYNIDRPAKAQDEALSKRVDEMFVQRKDVAR